MLKSVAVIEELVELRTRVSEIQTYTKALDDIASKIFRTSVSSAVEAGAMEEIQVRQRRVDIGVIISPVEPSMEADDIKKAIKTSCMKDKLPTPGDVVITKNKQVILKKNSGGETEIISSAFREVEELKTR